MLRCMLFMCSVFMFAYAQNVYAHAPNNDAVTQISGKVTDTDGEPLAGANIRVKDRVVGTATDTDGQFSLTVRQDPPLTLVVSIVGFKTKEVEITEANVSGLTIELEEQTIFGNDVVVSASRVEQGILQSPVSIEKLDVLEIQASPGTNFYDAIGNLKGVDFSAQSLTFKSINNRGFAANGNTRFVQLIDGIDNQAPGLNFAVGNIVGISELDLESAELIPGAASALYGPNALNGILLMNSKSPFEYQGLSFNMKLGVNHVDEEDDDMSLYEDYSLRYAKSFNNRFAFKVNASYLKASDFVAVDHRDQSDILERGANNRQDAAVPRLYDGLNTYGDFRITVGQIADAVIRGGGASGASTAAIRTLIPDGIEGAFTPNGYTEASFVDNTTESLKFGSALHYRLNDDYELVGQYNVGFGSTVYTANDRFVLEDFSIWTGKLELRNQNLFLRAYTTQENSGDTYAANTLASLINQRVYLPTYFQTFAGARLAGQSVENSHVIARQVADSNQPQPGSAAFDELAEELRGIPISEGGAKFLDKSGLYHAEGLYNLSNVIDPETVQLIAGLNVRRYALNSEGTLFALQDNGDEFDINEWGAYTQASKAFLDGNLNLQGSVRYDKNEYFEGQFSPRLSAILTVADVHNFRASIQQGFRIPTTQDQFIDLDVVSRRLVGSNPALVDRYNFETNPVYTAESVAQARAAVAAGTNPAVASQNLVQFQFEDFKTEKLNTFEVGYKTLINNKLFIDAYYYFSSYKDFIAEVSFTQAIPGGLRNEPNSATYSGANAPGTDNWKTGIVTGQDPAVANTSFPTQTYGFDINADGVVNAHGFAVTAEYSLPRGFTVGGNMAYNKLLDEDDLVEQGFNSSYNTPEWRYNIRLQNRKLTDNVGFNMVYRWQDAYIWESSIGNGVVPAFGTLDAQVSYKLSGLNTIVKLGGSNVLNERYTTSLANPRMGAIYYISFTFDQFLN